MGCGPAPSGALPALEPPTEYVDAHEYFFTPSSFALIIEEMQFLGFFDLEIGLITRTRGCEFLVTLRNATRRKTKDVFLERKRQLHLRILSEQMEGLSKLQRLIESVQDPIVTDSETGSPASLTG